MTLRERLEELHIFLEPEQLFEAAEARMEPRRECLREAIEALRTQHEDVEKAKRDRNRFDRDLKQVTTELNSLRMRREYELGLDEHRLVNTLTSRVEALEGAQVSVCDDMNVCIAKAEQYETGISSINVRLWRAWLSTPTETP